MKKIITGLIIVALTGVVIFKIMGNNPAAETRRQSAPLVKVENPLRETVIDKLQLTGDVL